MSRSGYVDYDIDHLEHGRWRGAVASAIRGKKGQAFLKELLAALDAMPEKYLTADSLVEETFNDDDSTTVAAVCTLGALGQKRCLDMKSLDPEDYDSVAEAFQINPKIVQEITYLNDEAAPIIETGEARWVRMRAWVAGNIKQIPETTA